MLGTIAAGIGPSDVETLFSFLNIPIPTSFLYVTFPKLENLIGQALQDVANESMQSALRQEIEAVSGLQYCEWLMTDEMAEIFGSYDMGWNKRSSGHRYDSMSGRAFLISCI